MHVLGHRLLVAADIEVRAVLQPAAQDLVLRRSGTQPFAAAVFHLQRRLEQEDAALWVREDGAAALGALDDLGVVERRVEPEQAEPEAAAAVLRDWRRAGRREALALAGGFAALTLPYSLALSIHLGEPTLIENHGGILVASRYLHGGNRLAPPGFGRVARAILQELATSPVTFIQVTLDQGRSLLPRGRRRASKDADEGGEAPPGEPLPEG